MQNKGRATFVVTSKEIIMVRGDAVEIEVKLYDGPGTETEHLIQPGETLTLTVRRNPKGDGEEPLFQITSEDTTIKIPPSATENLPYGAYSADVEFNSHTLASPITIWPQRDNYEMARFGAMKNFIIGTEAT